VGPGGQRQRAEGERLRRLAGRLAGPKAGSRTRLKRLRPAKLGGLLVGWAAKRRRGLAGWQGRWAEKGKGVGV
jgi:hypothetical protein